MGNNGSSDRLYLGGSKIAADGDCRHEIKRRLLLGSKAMTNLDSILKSRHCFADKCPSGQSYGFLYIHVQMWELNYKESWVPNKWCFWTVLLEKILESPLDCKEIQRVNPDWIFTEGMMLKLKFQYFGHLMWRTDSLEKTLMLGKIEGRRRRGWQRMTWLNGITDMMNMSLSKFQEFDGQGSVVSYSHGSQSGGHDWATKLKWIREEFQRKNGNYF